MLERQGFESLEEVVEVQEKKSRAMNNRCNSKRKDTEKMCPPVTTVPKQRQRQEEVGGVLDLRNKMATSGRFSDVRERRRFALLRRHQRNPAVTSSKTISTTTSGKGKVCRGFDNNKHHGNASAKGQGDEQEVTVNTTVDTSVNTSLNTTFSSIGEGNDVESAPPPPPPSVNFHRRARKADIDDADPVPPRPSPRPTEIQERILDEAGLPAKDQSHHQDQQQATTTYRRVDGFLVIKGPCNQEDDDEADDDDDDDSEVSEKVSNRLLKDSEKGRTLRVYQGDVDPVFVPRRRGGVPGVHTITTSSDDYPEDEKEEVDEDEDESEDQSEDEVKEVVEVERNDYENRRDAKVKKDHVHVVQRVNLCSDPSRRKTTDRMKHGSRRKHDDHDDNEEEEEEDLWEILGSALWTSMDGSCRSLAEVFPVLISDYEVKIHKFRRKDEYSTLTSTTRCNTESDQNSFGSSIMEDSIYDPDDDLSTIPESEGPCTTEFWQDAELEARRSSCGILQVTDEEISVDRSVSFSAEFPEVSTLQSRVDPVSFFHSKGVSENVPSVVQSEQSPVREDKKSAKTRKVKQELVVPSANQITNTTRVFNHLSTGTKPQTETVAETLERYPSVEEDAIVESLYRKILTPPKISPRKTVSFFAQKNVRVVCT